MAGILKLQEQYFKVCPWMGHAKFKRVKNVGNIFRVLIIAPNLIKNPKRGKGRSLWPLPFYSP